MINDIFSQKTTSIVLTQLHCPVNHMYAHWTKSETVIKGICGEGSGDAPPLLTTFLITKNYHHT